MKDMNLRKQLADCLRYIKNDPKFGYGWVQRDDVEVHKDTLCTTYDGVSLENLVEGIAPEDYKHVFVRGGYTEDYDGHEGSQIEIYTLRKQTDQEYFDSICGYILPTEYQQNQYEAYLRLKGIFG